MWKMKDFSGLVFWVYSNVFPMFQCCNISVCVVAQRSYIYFIFFSMRHKVVGVLIEIVTVCLLSARFSCFLRLISLPLIFPSQFFRKRRHLEASLLLQVSCKVHVKYLHISRYYYIVLKYFGGIVQFFAPVKTRNCLYGSHKVSVNAECP